MGLSWKQNVVRNFDRRACDYGQHCTVQSAVAERLASDLPVLKQVSVLEIGCGTGVFTQYLTEKYGGEILHITDASFAMLKHARANVKTPTTWFCLDAEKEQTGKTYDLIAASMVLQWFEDMEQGIKNLKAMLNPGGRLFFSVPGPDSFKEWRRALDTLGLPSGLLDFKKPEGIYREEIISERYRSGRDFLRSLKDTGASSSRKNYKPLSVTHMKNACAAFDFQNSGNVTWHILYGCLTRT